MTEQSTENIVSSCRSCGNTLTLPPEYLGKMIRCQKCSATYTVQANGDDSQASTASTQDDEDIKSRCPNCAQKVALPKEYIGKRIKCPECEEAYEVKAEEKEPVPEKEPEKEPEAKPEPAPDKKAEKEPEKEKAPEPKPEPAAAAKPVPKEEPAKQEAPKPAAKEEKPKPKAPNRVKTGDMVKKYSDEVSPDSLMTDFKPKGILIIAIFTIIVHVVVLGGTSYNFIYESLFASTEKLNEEQKKQAALADATLAINEIAKKYKLKNSDVTSQFSATGSRADKVTDKSKDKKTPGKKPEKKTEDKLNEVPKEKSALEKKFEKKEEGPEEFDFKDDF